MSTTSLTEAPPKHDEIEVSIFGAGIGECIVVHLGDAAWMVVDSCQDSGLPVALTYLASIGVAADAIKHVVVTHWHDDHIKGAARVFEAAVNAALHCSAALNREEFKRLIKANATPHVDTGTGELEQLLRTLKARTSGRAASMGPQWTSARQLVARTPRAQIWALSPSPGTLSLAQHELARLLPVEGPKRNVVAQKANALAVVLYIDFGGVSVLLGSDLEKSANPAVEWTAVVTAAQGVGARPSSIVKVAHHGSTTADDVEIWNALVTADVHAVTTPFQSSGLPRDTDKVRIRERTANAYFTAESSGRKVVSHDMRRIIEATAKSLRVLGARMGHVRLRFSAEAKSSSEIKAELRNGAFR